MLAIGENELNNTAHASHLMKYDCAVQALRHMGKKTVEKEFMFNLSPLFNLNMPLKLL